MRQKIFQIAKDLSIDSRIIVRKLTHENLPPPGMGQSENGRQRPWTPRSPVSVGLREMIREWHASGELVQTAVETGASNAARRGRKPRAGQSGVSTADQAGSLPSLPVTEALTTRGSSVAQQALEAITQIDRDARQKKQAQRQGLRESRTAIVQEIKSLNRQIRQIDKALQVITSRPAPMPPGQSTRTRRDLGELREQMGAWLENRRGEKYGAGALAKEFPELGNTAVAYVLKPLVAAGRIQTDTSQGSKRPNYFAP